MFSACCLRLLQCVLLSVFSLVACKVLDLCHLPDVLGYSCFPKQTGGLWMSFVAPWHLRLCTRCIALLNQVFLPSTWGHGHNHSGLLWDVGDAWSASPSDWSVSTSPLSLQLPLTEGTFTFSGPLWALSVLSPSTIVLFCCLWLHFFLFKCELWYATGCASHMPYILCTNDGCSEHICGGNEYKATGIQQLDPLESLGECCLVWVDLQEQPSIECTLASAFY